MAVADMYPLVQSQPFDLGPVEEARVDLVLKKPPPMPVTRLGGRVVTFAHQAIGGATVKVLDREYNPVAHTPTDAEGRYAFKNVLPPGFYKLTAAAEGYLAAQTRNFILRTGAPEFIDVALRRDPLCNTGVVYGLTVDAVTQMPLADTRVVLYDVREKPAGVTKSNEHGQYLFSMVQPGRYVLAASRDGYCTKTVHVLVSENAIIKCDVLLNRASEAASGTISGLIRNEARPPAHAVVALYRIDEGGETLIKLATTNSEGLYLFTDVGSGRYRVKSRPEQGGTYQEEFQI